MNWKTWLSLFLALAAGSAASFGVKAAFFTERNAESDADTDDFTPKERLLVANGLLPAGTELNAQNVRLTLTSERDVPRDGIFTFEGVAGRRITRELKDGEAISFYDLESGDEKQAEDSSFVPPGYVVVPIEICSASKANGGSDYLKTTKLDAIIKPGDVVDLVVVKQDVSSRAKRRLISEPVVQGVSVFAVRDENRRTSEGIERSSILSALLSKDQVEIVRKISEEGKMKVVFHSGSDLSYEDQDDRGDFLNDDLYSSIKNNDAILGRSANDDSGDSANSFNEKHVDSEFVNLVDETTSDDLSKDETKDADVEKGVFMNVSRKVEVDDSNEDSFANDNDLEGNSDDVLTGSEFVTGDETIKDEETVPAEETQSDVLDSQTSPVDSVLLLDDFDSEEVEDKNVEDDANTGDNSSATPVNESEQEIDEFQEVENRPRVFSPFATRGSTPSQRIENASMRIESASQRIENASMRIENASQRIGNASTN